MKRGRSKDEAAARDALVKTLTLRGCWVRTLHGNMFQPGLPDVLVHVANAYWCVVEVKRDGSVATVADVMALLHTTSPQRGNLVQLGRRDASAYIAVMHSERRIDAEDGWTLVPATRLNQRDLERPLIWTSLHSVVGFIIARSK